LFFNIVPLFRNTLHPPVHKLVDALLLLLSWTSEVKIVLRLFTISTCI